MKYPNANEVFNILLKLFQQDVHGLGSELRYNNHYQLLVSIMLSAQMTDAGVNNVTKELFSKLKSPHDAIQLGEAQINQYIKHINYHNTKSKHIVKMSGQLIENFKSTIPNTFQELITLAGVGRKTANLFLSLAYKQNRIAVDTHVFRVSNRLGLVNAKNPYDTERQLTHNVPETLHRQINMLLIPFGRKYCKAIKPQCIQCPLRGYCKFIKTKIETK